MIGVGMLVVSLWGLKYRVVKNSFKVRGLERSAMKKGFFKGWKRV